MRSHSRERARLRDVLRGWLASAASHGSELRAGLDRFVSEAPLELPIVGRVLLHAAVVGAAAGLVGAAFFAALEVAQRTLLEGLAGFTPLRAHGEPASVAMRGHVFRPWLLAILPALGGLASGLLTSLLAPEAAGGGGDATIDAYHRGGLVRWRVIPIKGAAAVAALSSGGSGGREGPTMQIGAAIGALVARLLPASRSERRVLFVAGIAAGIAAVFRTPLGAALLATEMLYRDDFEADALVPAILASVVSYSVAIATFGETTLFGLTEHFPFAPRHLPLYALLALVVAVAAAVFVRMLRLLQNASARLPVPTWARPAVGGLAVGLFGIALAALLASRHGDAARAFGVFGGGYGVAQVAIGGAEWFPSGGELPLLLCGVALAKMIASALTIGTGAAAGDFAPSLVIGALLGSAFGHGASALTGDPTLRPAAFALVGMGTFYGGVAHAPLSALVLVAELAGSYDLLVPMMLTIGIAYVALRSRSIYASQPLDRRASPVHAEVPAPALTALAAAPVRDLVTPSELPEFQEDSVLEELAQAARSVSRQRVALVRAADGRARGLVELEVLSALGPSERRWARAADAMVPFASLDAGTPWRDALAALQARGLSQLPVFEGGAMIGWVGDRELARAVVAAEMREAPPAR